MHPRRRSAVSRRFVRFAVPLLAPILAFTSTVQAEVVVLRNGRTFKAESVRTSGDSTEVTLAGGGTLRLPTSEIVRLANDETLASEWQFQNRTARYRKLRDVRPAAPPAAVR